MFSTVASPLSSIPNADIQSPDTSIFAVNHHHRRRPHMMMKLQFLPLTLPHPNPKPTKISCLHHPSKPYNYTPPRISSSTPPRDIIIDFGKHKGKMLGSLPSTYLKWVSKTLKDDGVFDFWAKLADRVLEDPIYRDRIEWEFAHRLMTSNHDDFSPSGKELPEELAELAERFGWDFGPYASWRIDYALLGTSFGGRIPRIDPNRAVEREEALAKREKPRAAAASGGEGSAREKRRERVRSKRRLKVATAGYVNRVDGDSEGEVDVDKNRTAEDVHKRFPGRESLMKRVIDRNKLL